MPRPPIGYVVVIHNNIAYYDITGCLIELEYAVWNRLILLSIDIGTG